MRSSKLYLGMPDEFESETRERVGPNLWELHRLAQRICQAALAPERAAHDLPPILERLDVPTLWIFGDPALDRLGPVSLSLERLERLRASGKPYTIKSFSGADHSLQLARGGEVPLQNVVAGWLPGVLR